MVEGREGDWECSGCKNRNYAFRSFCNRCKRPRLLADTNTHPNSKWLPRIGDWICTASIRVVKCVCVLILAFVGWLACVYFAPFSLHRAFWVGCVWWQWIIGCTNNNYASREKCKKCGQPKEVTAMPAIALSGVVASGGGLPPSFGMSGNSTFQRSLPSTSTWSSQNIYGANNVVPHPATLDGWRSGDWMSNCGFHNYSSRTQCKKCEAAPPALGIKRLAPDEPSYDWDSKRQCRS